MPVGTAGTGEGDAARSGESDRRRDHPRQHLSPDAASGAERVAEFGGLHKFTSWPGPILTDPARMSLSDRSRKTARRPSTVQNRCHPAADPASARRQCHRLCFDECTLASGGLPQAAVFDASIHALAERCRSSRTPATISSVSSRAASTILTAPRYLQRIGFDG